MTHSSSSSSLVPRFHAIVTTHTDQHLANTLLALIKQSPTPASITVTVDGEHVTVQDVVAAVAKQTGYPLNCVTRRHMGEPRRAQTRNNGVRALLEQGVDQSDWLLFIDGDCLAAPNLITAHTKSTETAKFSIGYFINLTEQQTAQLTEDSITSDRLTGLCLPHNDSLGARQKRYQKQLFLRRFGLTKKHKPKAVTGNIAIELTAFTAINGFDEAYTAWGFEDDDFSRRLYKKHYRPAIVVDSAMVLHQWHKSLRESDWLKNQSAKRFRKGRRRPAHCQMGLITPAPQPEPICRCFS
jgi:predicted glycosyltransferase involved in capsule biosynthesis